ncbi:MAG: hypothetical protein ABSH31_22730 [Bryobacteraceae bacterium]
MKKCSVALAGVLIGGLILFAIFRNHAEERQAKNFIGLLAAHNYSVAYAMWGCDETHPCPQYTFSKFLEDWGPKSEHAGNPAAASIGLSQSCGSGVVIRLDYKGSEPVPLWIERDTGTISFAPWPECPGRHLHLGAWLKSLFT